MPGSAHRFGRQARWRETHRYRFHDPRRPSHAWLTRTRNLSLLFLNHILLEHLLENKLKKLIVDVS